MSKTINANHILHEYIRLHSIKNEDKFLDNLETRVKKSRLEKEEGDRYSTNISRAISDQQKAELLHNNPIYDFIPLDGDARKAVFPLKEQWHYWWKVDETDKKIYEVVSDAADFGSGFMYQGRKVEYREIQMPKYNELTKSIDYIKEEVEQYNGVYSEYIRIEDIYFDGITIEDSNVAIWRKYWNKEDFIKAHKSNKEYKNIDEVETTSFDIFMSDNSKLPKLTLADTTDMLMEIRYYNKAEDCLVILANGVEVYNTPIPHLHKELPFVKYDNHIKRNRLIQMGNYELMESTEEYLDKVRQQTIDVTKANIGFSVVEKDSDFDPEVTKIGAFNFIELDNPGSMSHFTANIQSGGLVQLQGSGQEDAITLSGVDYRSQLITSGETATKTASKNTSQLKRINLILKRNSFNFYNRLAKLRLADLQFISSLGGKDIPLKGLHYDNGKFIKLQDGYGLFTITPEMIKGKFNVVLQTESLLGDSTEKEKENYLSFFQIFGNLKGADGKTILNPSRMVEIAGQKIGVDVETLLEKEEVGKSGEDVINDILKENNGMANGASNPMNDPNYIPPENRANDSGGVQVIGGGNTANQ